MNKVSDINARLADEKEQRLRRIRLIERETAEFAPMWKEKQTEKYIFIKFFTKLGKKFPLFPFFSTLHLHV